MFFYLQLCALLIACDSAMTDCSMGTNLKEIFPPQYAKFRLLRFFDLTEILLYGDVPDNLNNLTNLIELNLAHNMLAGPFPNLTKMDALNYVDLSNNSFESSEAPDWFLTLSSLTTLVIEQGSLQGILPAEVFSFPQLQQVLLRNNAFQWLLQHGLILVGNPVCTALSNTSYCQLQQQSTKPYSTSLANCGSKMCPIEQKLSPQSCECAYPYEGSLYFRAPSFRELSNENTFHSLEMSLWDELGLTPGSVFLQNPFFNVDDYLQVQVALFPPTGKYFNRSEIQRIGFYLSNQTYKPPKYFGPYYFIASNYPFPDGSRGNSLSSGVVVGIGIGCGLLVMSLVGVGIYAIRQKKRAEKAIGLSKPFASWAPKILLKNDGMNTNSTTSASSSATDFGASRDGPLKHPYNEVIAKNKDGNSVDNVNRDAFDHNGGSTLSEKAGST
ncbi:LEUCINE-RICH REPEAT-CONTAINING PROTEIN [Salix koriyanagi]|uniref:LEUCINE-RICH REPEAT-CONTAINING PROTEIN n=1 Tax=Salix koriyanagi TaxID=2511006 RepID=A0A9Q0ZU67_9ROSI|nr:LEUCINE-RICH REPEAT-CONTAINING PROTEIN [Salix koriyanagi]